MPKKTNDALRIISAELRESEMQFRAMNDAAFDPIFLINEAGVIVYVNRAGAIPSFSPWFCAEYFSIIKKPSEKGLS